MGQLSGEEGHPQEGQAEGEGDEPAEDGVPEWMVDGAEVPVVMVTGLDDIASIEQSYQAGATDLYRPGTSSSPYQPTPKPSPLVVVSLDFGRRLCSIS